MKMTLAPGRWELEPVAVSFEIGPDGAPAHLEIMNTAAEFAGARAARKLRRRLLFVFQAPLQ